MSEHLDLQIDIVIGKLYLMTLVQHFASFLSKIFHHLFFFQLHLQ